MQKTRQWSVWEREFKATKSYEKPFVDVRVAVEFTSPTGRVLTVEGFHDGDNLWRVRFAPDEPGKWRFRCSSLPEDHGFTEEGSFEVEGVPTEKGFIRADRNVGWGFRWDDGAPAFLIGDTMYNLFGYAYSGYDTRALLEHRKSQGFDLIRVRAFPSTFHRWPSRYFRWQTREVWPWGGIPQSPLFDEFNLDYFRTVDDVVRLCDELNLGLEFIFEAWMFEFPFNDRARFTAEDEELWIRYLVARYGAFRSIYIWTTANEHIYYPAGYLKTHPWEMNDTRPDRWVARLARLIKSVDAHRHPVAVHTMFLPEPTYADRFRGYPEIDVILFQVWGLRDEHAWTAAGIDEAIRHQVGGARQVPVLAEYGYESVPGIPVIKSRQYMYRDHNRRGAWRGCFSGVLIFTGFENTWGPFMTMEVDAEGAGDFQHLRRFFEKVVPFASLKVRDSLVNGGRKDIPGGVPLCLADESLDVVAVYLPVGGQVQMGQPLQGGYQATWFDPRTGQMQKAGRAERGSLLPCPSGSGTDDWALVLMR